MAELPVDRDTFEDFIETARQYYPQDAGLSRRALVQKYAAPGGGLRKSYPQVGELYDQYERPSKGEEFSKGIDRGWEITKAMGHGLAAASADMVGAESWRQALLEGYQDNIQRAGELKTTVDFSTAMETGKLNDYLQWAAGGSGELIPNLAVTFGTGLATGIGRKALLRLSDKNMLKVAQQQHGRSAVDAMVKAHGTKEAARLMRDITPVFSGGVQAGMIGSSIGMNTGEIYGGIAGDPDVDQSNVTKAERLGYGLSLGIVAGLLDSVTQTRLAKALLNKAPSEAVNRTVRDRLTRSLAKVIENVGVEAVTEGTQEALAEWGKQLSDEQRIFNEEEFFHVIREAAALGGLGGLGFGGVSGVASFVKEGGTAAQPETVEGIEEAPIDPTEPRSFGLAQDPSTQTQYQSRENNRQAFDYLLALNDKVEKSGIENLSQAEIDHLQFWGPELAKDPEYADFISALSQEPGKRVELWNGTLMDSGDTSSRTSRVKIPVTNATLPKQPVEVFPTNVDMDSQFRFARIPTDANVRMFPVNDTQFDEVMENPLRYVNSGFDMIYTPGSENTQFRMALLNPKRIRDLSVLQGAKPIEQSRREAANLLQDSTLANQKLNKAMDALEAAQAMPQPDEATINQLQLDVDGAKAEVDRINSEIAKVQSKKFNWGSLEAELNETWGQDVVALLREGRIKGSVAQLQIQQTVDAQVLKSQIKGMGGVKNIKVSNPQTAEEMFKKDVATNRAVPDYIAQDLIDIDDLPSMLLLVRGENARKYAPRGKKNKFKKKDLFLFDPREGKQKLYPVDSEALKNALYPPPSLEMLDRIEAGLVAEFSQAAMEDSFDSLISIDFEKGQYKTKPLKPGQVSRVSEFFKTRGLNTKDQQKRIVSRFFEERAGQPFDEDSRILTRLKNMDPQMRATSIALMYPGDANQAKREELLGKVGVLDEGQSDLIDYMSGVSPDELLEYNREEAVELANYQTKLTSFLEQLVKKRETWSVEASEQLAAHLLADGNFEALADMGFNTEAVDLENPGSSEEIQSFINELARVIRKINLDLQLLDERNMDQQEQVLHVSWLENSPLTTKRLTEDKRRWLEEQFGLNLSETDERGQSKLARETVAMKLDYAAAEAAALYQEALASTDSLSQADIVDITQQAYDARFQLVENKMAYYESLLRDLRVQGESWRTVLTNGGEITDPRTDEPIYATPLIKSSPNNPDILRILDGTPAGTTIFKQLQFEQLLKEQISFLQQLAEPVEAEDEGVSIYALNRMVTRLNIAPWASPDWKERYWNLHQSLVSQARKPITTAESLASYRQSITDFLDYIGNAKVDGILVDAKEAKEQGLLPQMLEEVSIQIENLENLVKDQFNKTEWNSISSSFQNNTTLNLATLRKLRTVKLDKQEFAGYTDDQKEQMLAYYERYFQTAGLDPTEADLDQRLNHVLIERWESPMDILKSLWARHRFLKSLESADISEQIVQNSLGESDLNPSFFKTLLADVMSPEVEAILEREGKSIVQSFTKFGPGGVRDALGTLPTVTATNSTTAVVYYDDATKSYRMTSAYRSKDGDVDIEAVHVPTQSAAASKAWKILKKMEEGGWVKLPSFVTESWIKENIKSAKEAVSASKAYSVRSVLSKLEPSMGDSYQDLYQLGQFTYDLSGLSEEEQGLQKTLIGERQDRYNTLDKARRLIRYDEANQLRTAGDKSFSDKWSRERVVKDASTLEVRIDSDITQAIKEEDNEKLAESAEKAGADLEGLEKEGETYKVIRKGTGEKLVSSAASVYGDEVDSTIARNKIIIDEWTEELETLEAQESRAKGRRKRKSRTPEGYPVLEDVRAGGIVDNQGAMSFLQAKFIELFGWESEKITQEVRSDLIDFDTGKPRTVKEEVVQAWGVQDAGAVRVFQEQLNEVQESVGLPELSTREVKSIVAYFALFNPTKNGYSQTPQFSKSLTKGSGDIGPWFENKGTSYRITSNGLNILLRAFSVGSPLGSQIQIGKDSSAQVKKEIQRLEKKLEKATGDDYVEIQRQLDRYQEGDMGRVDVKLSDQIKKALDSLSQEFKNFDNTSGRIENLKLLLKAAGSKIDNQNSALTFTYRTNLLEEDAAATKTEQLKTPAEDVKKINPYLEEGVSWSLDREVSTVSQEEITQEAEQVMARLARGEVWKDGKWQQSELSIIDPDYDKQEDGQVKEEFLPFDEQADDMSPEEKDLQRTRAYLNVIEEALVSTKEVIDSTRTSLSTGDDFSLQARDFDIYDERGNSVIIPFAEEGEGGFLLKDLLQSVGFDPSLKGVQSKDSKRKKVGSLTETGRLSNIKNGVGLINFAVKPGSAFSLPITSAQLINYTQGVEVTDVTPLNDLSDLGNIRKAMSMSEIEGVTNPVASYKGKPSIAPRLLGALEKLGDWMVLSARTDERTDLITNQAAIAGLLRNRKISLEVLQMAAASKGSAIDLDMFIVENFLNYNKKSQLFFGHKVNGVYRGIDRDTLLDALGYAPPAVAGKASKKATWKKYNSTQIALRLADVLGMFQDDSGLLSRAGTSPAAWSLRTAFQQEYGIVPADVWDKVRRQMPAVSDYAPDPNETFGKDKVSRPEFLRQFATVAYQKYLAAGQPIPNEITVAGTKYRINPTTSQAKRLKKTVPVYIDQGQLEIAQSDEDARYSETRITKQPKVVNVFSRQSPGVRSDLERAQSLRIKLYRKPNNKKAKKELGQIEQRILKSKDQHARLATLQEQLKSINSTKRYSKPEVREELDAEASKVRKQIESIQQAISNYGRADVDEYIAQLLNTGNRRIEKENESVESFGGDPGENQLALQLNRLAADRGGNTTYSGAVLDYSTDDDNLLVNAFRSEFTGIDYLGFTEETDSIDSLKTEFNRTMRGMSIEDETAIPKAVIPDSVKIDLYGHLEGSRVFDQGDPSVDDFRKRVEAEVRKYFSPVVMDGIETPRAGTRALYRAAIRLFSANQRGWKRNEAFILSLETGALKRSHPFVQKFYSFLEVVEDRFVEFFTHAAVESRNTKLGISPMKRAYSVLGMDQKAFEMMDEETAVQKLKSLVMEGFDNSPTTGTVRMAAATFLLRADRFVPETKDYTAEALRAVVGNQVNRPLTEAETEAAKKHDEATLHNLNIDINQSLVPKLEEEIAAVEAEERADRGNPEIIERLRGLRSNLDYHRTLQATNINRRNKIETELGQRARLQFSGGLPDPIIEALEAVDPNLAMKVKANVSSVLKWHYREGIDSDKLYVGGYFRDDTAPQEQFYKNGMSQGTAYVPNYEREEADMAEDLPAWVPEEWMEQVNPDLSTLDWSVANDDRVNEAINSGEIVSLDPKDIAEWKRKNFPFSKNIASVGSSYDPGDSGALVTPVFITPEGVVYQGGPYSGIGSERKSMSMLDWFLTQEYGQPGHESGFVRRLSWEEWADNIEFFDMSARMSGTKWRYDEGGVLDASRLLPEGAFTADPVDIGIEEPVIGSKYKTNKGELVTYRGYLNMHTSRGAINPAALSRIRDLLPDDSDVRARQAAISELDQKGVVEVKGERIVSSPETYERHMFTKDVDGPLVLDWTKIAQAGFFEGNAYNKNGKIYVRSNLFPVTHSITQPTQADLIRAQLNARETDGIIEVTPDSEGLNIISAPLISVNFEWMDKAEALDNYLNLLAPLHQAESNLRKQVEAEVDTRADTDAIDQQILDLERKISNQFKGGRKGGGAIRTVKKLQAEIEILQKRRRQIISPSEARSSKLPPSLVNKAYQAESILAELPAAITKTENLKLEDGQIQFLEKFNRDFLPYISRNFIHGVRTTPDGHKVLDMGRPFAGGNLTFNNFIDDVSSMFANDGMTSEFPQHRRALDILAKMENLAESYEAGGVGLEDLAALLDTLYEIRTGTVFNEIVPGAPEGIEAISASHFLSAYIDETLSSNTLAARVGEEGDKNNMALANGLRNLGTDFIEGMMVQYRGDMRSGFAREIANKLENELHRSKGLGEDPNLIPTRVLDLDGISDLGSHDSFQDSPELLDTGLPIPIGEGTSLNQATAVIQDVLSQKQQASLFDIFKPLTKAYGTEAINETVETILKSKVETPAMQIPKSWIQGGKVSPNFYKDFDNMTYEYGLRIASQLNTLAREISSQKLGVGLSVVSEDFIGASGDVDSLHIQFKISDVATIGEVNEDLDRKLTGGPNARQMNSSEFVPEKFIRTETNIGGIVADSSLPIARKQLRVLGKVRTATARDILQAYSETPVGTSWPRAVASFFLELDNLIKRNQEIAGQDASFLEGVPTIMYSEPTPKASGISEGSVQNMSVNQIRQIAAGEKVDQRIAADPSVLEAFAQFTQTGSRLNFPRSEGLHTSMLLSSGIMDHKTIPHEIQHAFTGAIEYAMKQQFGNVDDTARMMQGTFNPSVGSTPQQKAFIKAYRDLEQVYMRAKLALAKSGLYRYELSNIQEFASAIFSDPSFLEALGKVDGVANLKSKGLIKTFFEAFFRMVESLLSLPEGSLGAQALEMATDFVIKSIQLNLSNGLMEVGDYSEVVMDGQSMEKFVDAEDIPFENKPDVDAERSLKNVDLAKNRQLISEFREMADEMKVPFEGLLEAFGFTGKKDPRNVVNDEQAAGNLDPNAFLGKMSQANNEETNVRLHRTYTKLFTKLVDRHTQLEKVREEKRELLLEKEEDQALIHADGYKDATRLIGSVKKRVSRLLRLAESEGAARGLTESLKINRLDVEDLTEQLGADFDSQLGKQLKQIRDGKVSWEYFQAISRLGINWETDGIREIRRKIKDYSSQDLTADDMRILDRLNKPDNNALKALLIALLKRERDLVTLFRLRGERSMKKIRKFQERISALSSGMEDYESARKELMDDLSKGELKESSKLILRYIEGGKNLKKLRKEVEAADNFFEYYEKGIELIEAKVDQYDSALGVLDEYSLIDSKGGTGKYLTLLPEKVSGNARPRVFDGTKYIDLPTRVVTYKRAKEGEKTPYLFEINIDTKDGEELKRFRNDLAANRQWLEMNEHLMGTAFYEKIRSMTNKLLHLDVRKHHEVHAGIFTKMLDAPIQALKRSGTVAGVEAARRLLVYQNMIMQNTAQSKTLAAQHGKLMRDTVKLSGYDSINEFRKDVYSPVIVNIQREPGIVSEEEILRYSQKWTKQNVFNKLGRDQAAFNEFEKSFLKLLRQEKKHGRWWNSVRQSADLGVQRKGNYLIDPVSGMVTPFIGEAVQKGAITSPLKLARQKAFRDYNLLTRDPDSGVRTRSANFIDSLEALRIDDEEHPLAHLHEANKFEAQLTPEVWSILIEPLFNEFHKLKAFGDIDFNGTVFTDKEMPVSVYLASLPSKDGTPISPMASITSLRDLYRVMVGDNAVVEKDDGSLEFNNGVDVVQLGRFMRTVARLSEQNVPTMGEGSISMNDRFGKVIMKSKKLWKVLDDLKRNSEIQRDDQQFNPGVGHFIIDARTNPWISTKYLDTSETDETGMAMTLRKLAMTQAFGRDAKEMVGLFIRMENQLTQRLEALEKKHGRYDKDVVKYRTFFRNLADAKSGVRKRLEKVFTASSGELADIPGWMEGVGLAVSGTLAGPRSMIVQAQSITDLPFLMGGWSKESWTALKNSFATFFKNTVLTNDGLLGSIGLDFATLGQEEQYMKDLIFQSQYENLKWDEYSAETGYLDAYDQKNFGLFNTQSMFRKVSRRLSKGNALRPWKLPMNGFKIFSKNVALANSVGLLKVYNNLVDSAAAYFKANPNDANNPSFNFLENQRAFNKVFGSKREGVDFFLLKSHEYTGKTIEEAARDRVNNPSKKIDTRILNGIVMMSNNEITGEGTINTRPWWSKGSQLGRLASVITGWGLWKTGRVNESWRGQGSTKTGAAARLMFAKNMAIVALPFAYAWSTALDYFDEKLRGKAPYKPRGWWRGGIAAADRSGTFGLWGSAANSMANWTDPKNGIGKGFLMERVYVLSTVKGFADGLKRQMAQQSWPWEDIPTTARMIPGANGFLQYVQMANNLAVGMGMEPLSQQEYGFQVKTNARRYLHAVGEDMGFEMKGTTAGGLPTRQSFYMNKMFLAAMADDPRAFEEARRGALKRYFEFYKAQEKFSDRQAWSKAEKAIKDSWSSRDPFNAPFRFAPSQKEVQIILRGLGEFERSQVLQAKNLYDKYERFIK